MTPDEIRDLLAGAADRYRNVRASIVFTLRRPGSRRIVSERRVVYERPDKAVQEEWRLTPTVHRLVDRTGRNGERWWQQRIGGKWVDVHRGGSTMERIWLGPDASASEAVPMERVGDLGVVNPAVVELLDPERVSSVPPTLEDRGETIWLERNVHRVGASFEIPDAFEILPWADGELLVDAERGVILRAEDSGPDGATMTSEVTEIAFDLDLPPETFEPPEGSRVVEFD